MFRFSICDNVIGKCSPWQQMLRQRPLLRPPLWLAFPDHISNRRGVSLLTSSSFLLVNCNSTLPHYRSNSSGWHRRRRSATPLHSAAELRQGLGPRLSAQLDQGHSVLGRSAFASSAATARRGSAHNAHRWTTSPRVNSHLVTDLYIYIFSNTSTHFLFVNQIHCMPTNYTYN